MNNDLMHYGVRGMKWGVRRSRVHGPQPARSRMTADDYRSIKKTIDTSNSVVNETSRIRGEVKRKKQKNKTYDLSNMSDKELREVVNRMNMEQQYSNLMASQTSRGKDRVDRILDNVGTALTIGSSALTLAIAIKELRK